MPVVETLHDAFPLRRSALLWGSLDEFGDIKIRRGLRPRKFSLSVIIQHICIAERHWDMGGVSGGNSARFLSSIVYTWNQSMNNRITRHDSRDLMRKL
jgi:hypothetical protein